MSPHGNQNKKKTSLCISGEAVRIALMEILREEVYAHFLCQVSSIMKFLTFHQTTALQHCYVRGWEWDIGSHEVA